MCMHNLRAHIKSFAPNLSGEPCQYSFQPTNATMTWLLTSRYWDLDQLVIENYKINYGLRYEPSKTHTKAIYLAFMRSPYSYFVSRDSFSKTNRFAKEIDCKTVGLFFSKSVKKSVKRESLSASFQTFCLTARAYLNTQKYGLFSSLPQKKNILILSVT